MQGTVVGGTTLILSAPSVNGNESHEFDQQEGEYLEDFASVGHRSLNSLHGDSNESRYGKRHFLHTRVGVGDKGAS
jgi:hypothetical protein